MGEYALGLRIHTALGLGVSTVVGSKLAYDQFNNWAYGIKVDPQTPALCKILVNTVGFLAVDAIMELYDIKLFEEKDDSFNDLSSRVSAVNLESVGLLIGSGMGVGLVANAVEHVVAKYMMEKTTSKPIM